MTAAHSIFDSLTPSDLGLPPKFVSFRLPQRQALEWLTEQCEHPASAASIPTGVGKTSLAVAYARLLGVKAVYLVATKALEAQVLSDFSSMGMVNVHGRANYTCPNYGDCDKGADHKCSLAQTESCPYSRQVNLAADSDLVVTNYAYYLWSKGVRNKAFEGTGLLICDEAHALEHQLGSFASVKLYARELSALKCPYRPKTEMSDVIKDEADAWKIWAMAEAAKLASKSDVRDLDDDEQDLLDRMRKITRMHSNWVWQFDDRGHCSFEPVRVAAYTRGLLSSVPRVLMMSASLSEFALKLLMPSDTYYDYRAWPPVFPQQNSPVYHIPTVKLSWKSTDEDYKQVVEAADAIIDSRSDRRGIVHTVSYARSRRALEYSRHKDRFVWNEDAGSLAGCLAKFKAAGTSGILVTPSVEEGFDFPGAEAEYQIVLKFPFPNETQRVVKERCTQIPGYRLHHAAQKIVQIRGRAVRSDTDRAELFILDNAVRQLCGPEGRSYCPPGFRIFTVNDVPPAPPKIT